MTETELMPNLGGDYGQQFVSKLNICKGKRKPNSEPGPNRTFYRCGCYEKKAVARWTGSVFPSRWPIPSVKVFYQPAGAIHQAASNQKAEDDQNDVPDCH